MVSARRKREEDGDEKKIGGGYGMTESTAIGTRGFNLVGNNHKYSSVGLLAPNMEAKVVDWTTGSCMPPKKAGELLLRGPGVMKGYLHSRDATRLTIEEDGWLHTGDIVYFDNDGYLYIIDRLKDIIKYKGFQVCALNTNFYNLFIFNF
ncbi:4-coumarate--CoA ligase-like 6 [Bienertia sinuspersici]